MKECILLVGHGSRDVEGNREIEAFAEQWRSRQPGWRIEVCFIEFAGVLVPDGLARAAQGAARVIVVPLILNAAGHVKMELPEFIAAARQQHPQTAFVYAPHLGACDPVLAILRRRLNRAMLELDMPDPANTGVILLGRGSSDRMANGDVARMARWLQETGRHELVEVAFTGITFPRLERVVQRQVRLGMMQVVVLPYYLFTGTLMKRIERQMAHLSRQYPQVRFACGGYFGFEDEIFEVLETRVQEAGAGEVRMPCDGCKYREAQAGAEGAHHHGHGPRPAHAHGHFQGGAGHHHHDQHRHDHPSGEPAGVLPEQVS